MPKDDPFANTTLWLDRDHMEIAMDRSWRVWKAQTEHSHATRQDWDIAWAAAVAAFSFLQEGRLGPPADTSDQTVDNGTC